MSEPQHYWPNDKPRLPEQPAENEPARPSSSARVLMPITLDYTHEVDYRRKTGGEIEAPKASRNLSPREMDQVTMKSLDE